MRKKDKREEMLQL